MRVATRLSGNASFADAVPCYANHAMHEYCITVAGQLASAVLSPVSCAEKVRVQIRGRIKDGEPSMTEVAQSLGVSARTMRRRLAEERMTYRSLIEEVRRERATNLLASTSSITHVALDLGFSDSTAFSRAYRRW